jgi:Flp pilus assembly protein TadG
MKRERGMILATTAAAMVALIVVLGLAVDLGMVYTARTSAQHAADAGALAGAYAFLTYPSSSINNPAYGGSQGVATTMATDAAIQNKVLGTTLSAADVTVTFPASNRLTVAVQTAIPTYFMKVVGVRQVAIRAHATAEAASLPSATSCLRPFWVTASSMHQGGNCSSPLLAVGSTMQLWQSTIASQWGLIGQSASTINNQIQSCSGIVNACGDILQDKPGASVGGVLSPVQQVICPYENGNCLPCSSDPTLNCGDWSYQGPGEYLNSNTRQTDGSSPALMTIAVWDDCSGSGPSHGRQTFPIAGYAQIFVTDVGNPSSKGIDAKFLGMGQCRGSSSSGGGSGATGPAAIPIRLINP